MRSVNKTCVTLTERGNDLQYLGVYRVLSERIVLCILEGSNTPTIYPLELCLNLVVLSSEAEHRVQTEKYFSD